MPLILPEHYNQIRAAIRTSLDADGLPDEIIEFSIYKSAAEAEVEALTSDTGEHARNAAILICAALLARRIPQITADSDDVGGPYQIEPVDIDKLVADLRARATAELALIIDTTGNLTGSIPTHFTVGGGRRV